MKKLVILPLVSLLISGCSCSPGKKSKSSEEEIFTSSTSQDGIIYPVTVEQGEEHSLPWNVNYALIKTVVEGKELSYAAYNKTFDFDGTPIRIVLKKRSSTPKNI